MKYKQNLMAKALYDNVPETPEELEFHKGDILTVIEQNTGGLEGWWLCSLHGRQGIAPGNRLKLLVGGMFEGGTVSTAPPHGLACQQSPHTPKGSYQVPPLHQSTQGQPIYQVPPTPDVYQVPQRSALAADAMPNRVLTPTRKGQAYSYSLTPSNSQKLYDVPPLRTQGVYDIPPSKQIGQSSHGQSVYDIPPSQDVRNQGLYDVPLQSQGVNSTPPCQSVAALDEGNYDFPQPHKQKAEGVYDIPPAFLSKTTQCTQSNYDFPLSSEPCVTTGSDSSIYDVPASQITSTASHDLYDIPRSMQTQHRDRERGHGRGIYDVPATDLRTFTDMTDSVNCLSLSSTGSSMSTSSSTAGSPAEGRLAIDLDSALQRLGCLQRALDASVSTLQGLAASPCWRTHSFLEQWAGEVRRALERVRTALADFLAFGRGAATNATTLSDPALHSKLRRQLQRLEDAQQILQQTHRSLESSGWTPAALASGPGQQGKGDELDRAIMVSRTVPDDGRQLASTVRGSAELLFRRAPVEGIVHPFTCSPPQEDNSSSQTKPFPVGQDSEQCVKSWMEDYDYVHLQQNQLTLLSILKGKEEFERQQKELLEKEDIVKQNKIHLAQDQLNQFKKLEQEVIKPVENDITQWISHQHSTGSTSPSGSSSTSSVGGGAHLCGQDRQLLAFYGEQCEQHFVSLLNAVDAFFGCVATGQPPRIFVAHAKFVILSAHKLVFIGDTLSRQASSPDVANRVMDSSNVLCELLKTVVASTKTAALHYPNTPTVQEMVDRVTHLSHQAQQFKVQLLHMATF
ncbi:enhancer of filamentation 1 isoform X1 [Electrophorus electricus]|uniref:enhancer of filamentation 1 isoform X1 n=1 Tax=Electrophorus electricus TaxID=8005 RepID=UPI0015D0A054|nr:enhancer of filamentation 1 isoform X1 [Electrophorus electricus]